MSRGEIRILSPSSALPLMNITFQDAPTERELRDITKEISSVLISSRPAPFVEKSIIFFH